MAVRSALKQPAEKCPEEPRWRGTCYCYEKEGPVKQDCPQVSKPPGLPVESVKDHTWGETALWGNRSQGSHSQGNRDWGCLGIPTQVPILIIPEEPWVLITVGAISQFSFGHRATFSVLTEAPGPLSSRSTAIKELSEWAKHYFNHSLRCNWDSVLFSRGFWLYQCLSHPFWGEIYWTRSRPLFS